MDLNRLMEWCLSDSRVKVVKNEIPFMKNAFLYDVSFRLRGNEDEIYRQDPVLLQNVRRGTSFLLKENEMQWARKGLPKFFDYSSKDSKEATSLNFLNIIENLKKNSEVIIWKTEKANGENAQISFNASISAWIIGSKNVSLAARDASDLGFYPGLRYNFAKMIAEAFFFILHNCNQSEIEDIKIRLKDCSLIGEYVGNPECQHVISYSQISILFFAIVDHFNEFPCESCNKTMEFCEQFRIPHVNFKRIGGVREENEFFECMEKLESEIANLNIEEGKEGFVVYITDANVSLGLCKIKTLAYKILRKMRESLKNYSETPENSNFLETFTQYIQKTELKTQKNLSHYISIAQKMQQDLLLTKETLQNNFASYLTNTSERTVFVSIGIPGIGKSHLSSQLKQLYPSLTIISSDEIRGNLISSLKESFPSLSSSQLFSKSDPDYKKIFNSSLINSEGLVYVDKNFPPNAFPAFLKVLSSKPTKVIVFIPDCKDYKSSGFVWPMSLEVLYVCIQRILKRKDHKTLMMENECEDVGLLIMMYNLYKGYGFGAYKKQEVKKIIKARFVDETVEVPDKVRKKLDKIVCRTKVGKKPEMKKVKRLIECLPDMELVFPEIKINFTEEVPVFLGLEIQDFNPIALILTALEGFSREFPLDGKVLNDLEVFRSITPYTPPNKLPDNWESPSPLHLTTLFIGKSSKVFHSPHYKTFIENEIFPMKVTYLVYVPRKIFCATIEFLETAPLVANKIPHITLMTHKTLPKQSNALIENLSFNKGINGLESPLGICYTFEVEGVSLTGISKKFY